MINISFSAFIFTYLQFKVDENTKLEGLGRFLEIPTQPLNP